MTIAINRTTVRTKRSTYDYKNSKHVALLSEVVANETRNFGSGISVVDAMYRRGIHIDSQEAFDALINGVREMEEARVSEMAQ